MICKLCGIEMERRDYGYFHNWWCPCCKITDVDWEPDENQEKLFDD